MQVDIVLAQLEKPYIVLFIAVVLLKMVGEIFGSLTLQFYLPKDCIWEGNQVQKSA